MSSPVDRARLSCDPHCDIVKLAVVLHRMLADGTPFAAERAAAAAA